MWRAGAWKDLERSFWGSAESHIRGLPKKGKGEAEMMASQRVGIAKMAGSQEARGSEVQGSQEAQGAGPVPPGPSLWESPVPSLGVLALVYRPLPSPDT